MPKILLKISDLQHITLKERSESAGLTVSEFVRRIFDLFLSDSMCSGKRELKPKLSKNKIKCPLINPEKEQKNG